jgi:Septum formation
MPRRTAALVVAALALAVAGGCSSGDDDSAARSTTTTSTIATTTTTPDVVPVVDLDVGDCFDEEEVRDDEPSLLQEVHVVDCAGPHRNEVYATVAYDAGGEEYPGNGPLAEFAQDRCVSAFPEFVGAPVERTDYGIGTVYPDEESWGTGDRAVVCVLYDSADEPLEGTARNTGD